MTRKNGLIVVLSPPRASVDLVLVHGLFGDPMKTWTYESLRRSVFWPADLLPEDIPTARILTFGYDASIAHFWGRPAENRVDTYSTELFEQLNDYRYNSGTTGRPIILVAHSLGGLVCANALVDAASGLNSLQDVAQSVRRIAFLGTPHEGSEKARWAETGRRFLTLFKTTNKELAKDLTPKSEKLAKLSEQFPILLSRRAQNAVTLIDVVCFYEGKSTRKAGVDFDVIVSKTSACLPGYQRRLLEADHQNMVRYKSRDDVNYQRLRGVLQRWGKELEIPLDQLNVPTQPSTWFSQPTSRTPVVQNNSPLELDGSPGLVSNSSSSSVPVVNHAERHQQRTPVRNQSHESMLDDESLYGHPQSTAAPQTRRKHRTQNPRPSHDSQDASSSTSEDIDDSPIEEEEQERPKPRLRRTLPPKLQTRPQMLPPGAAKMGSVVFQGTSQLQLGYNMGTINLRFDR